MTDERRAEIGLRSSLHGKVRAERDEDEHHHDVGDRRDEDAHVPLVVGVHREPELLHVADDETREERAEVAAPSGRVDREVAAPRSRP